MRAGQGHQQLRLVWQRLRLRRGGVQVPADAELGSYDLTGSVGYQVCREEFCDPPSAVDYSISVMVAAEMQEKTETCGKQMQKNAERMQERMQKHAEKCGKKAEKRA